MSKSKHSKCNGPKNQNYFFAYSDRMLSDNLFSAFCYLFTGKPIQSSFVGESDSIVNDILGKNKRIIEKDEIVIIDYPYTSGDLNAKYSLVVVSKNNVNYLLSNIDSSISKNYLWNLATRERYFPRELFSIDNNVTSLLNWKAMGQLSEFHSGILNGNVGIPFRVPNDVLLQDIISNAGFVQKEKIKYTTFDFSNIKGPVNNPIRQVKQEAFIDSYNINNFLIL